MAPSGESSGGWCEEYGLVHDGSESLNEKEDESLGRSLRRRKLSGAVGCVLGAARTNPQHSERSSGCCLGSLHNPSHQKRRMSAQQIATMINVLITKYRNTRNTDS